MIPVAPEAFLTVAIPTINRAERLRCRLAELKAQYNGDFRVLVSDNGSADATPEVVRECQRDMPYLDYHRFETNQGFDRNILNCFTQAKSEYVWINSDNYPIESGAAGKLAGKLREVMPTVATAGILKPDGSGPCDPDTVEKVYRAEAELPNYRPFLRAFCVTGIVLRRLPLEEARVAHAMGTWYVQLTICQELLTQRFVYAVWPTLFVARRGLNLRTTRPYLEFWLNGPLCALKVEKAALKFPKFQQYWAETWRDYLTVLLASKVGLYSLNRRLSRKICADAWALLGPRSLRYFACHLLAFIIPALLIRVAYRIKLIAKHGFSEGEKYFAERVNRISNQGMYSDY